MNNGGNYNPNDPAAVADALIPEIQSLVDHATSDLIRARELQSLVDEIRAQQQQLGDSENGQ